MTAESEYRNDCLTSRGISCAPIAPISALVAAFTGVGATGTLFRVRGRPRAGVQGNDMYCHKCGSPVGDGDGFCAKCGERTGGPGGVATMTLERPGVVTILASLDIVVGVMGFLALLVFIAARAATREEMSGGPLAVFLACGVIAFLSGISIVAGAGLLKLKPYGRTLQIVLACFGLLGFPLWTIVSALTLYYLSRPGLKLLYSGRSPQQMTPGEIAEIRNVSHGAAVAAVTVLVLVVLSVPLIGIVAAIAVPGLLRARQSGNEATAIGRVHAVVAAEMAYAAGNGGYYDVPGCLSEPRRCVPSAEGTPFVSGDVLADGPYTATFYPGEAAPLVPGRTPALSPSSLVSFAYVLVPATPGAGTRAFCGDATGLVRASNSPFRPLEEIPPAILFKLGRCPETWASLQP